MYLPASLLSATEHVGSCLTGIERVSELQELNIEIDEIEPGCSDRGKDGACELLFLENSEKQNF